MQAPVKRLILAYVQLLTLSLLGIGPASGTSIGIVDEKCLPARESRKIFSGTGEAVVCIFRSSCVYLLKTEITLGPDVP